MFDFGGLSIERLLLSLSPLEFRMFPLKMAEGGRLAGPRGLFWFMWCSRSPPSAMSCPLVRGDC